MESKKRAGTLNTKRHECIDVAFPNMASNKKLKKYRRKNSTFISLMILCVFIKKKRTEKANVYFNLFLIFWLIDCCHIQKGKIWWLISFIDSRTHTSYIHTNWMLWTLVPFFSSCSFRENHAADWLHCTFKLSTKKNRVYNRQIAYRLHKKRMADSSIWYNVFMLFFHSRFFSRPLNSIAVKVCNIVSVSSMYDILSTCLCVFVWVWGSVWMEFLYGQQILCIISFSSSLPYLMSVAQVSRTSGAADTPNNVRNER